MKYALFGFGVLLSFVCIAKTGLAQQETQLVVTPAIIDAPAVAGESTKRTIQISNNNDYALPISVEVQSAVIDGEPLEGVSNDRYDVSNWVSFDKKTYIFESGETRQIPFTITPPFTASAGGHYAQISIRGLTLESSSGQQGLVFPEIGVPLLVTVPGEIVEDARVQDVSIFPRFVTPNKPIDIEIPVENIGTVHNLVRVKMVFVQGDSVVDELELPPGIILPGTRKLFRGVWQPEQYGQFDAYVELAYGSNRTTTRSQAEQVLVMPPVSSLILLGIFVWLGTYLWPRRQNIVGAIKTIFTAQ